MNWNPLRRLILLQQMPTDPAIRQANSTLDRLIIEFDSAENVIKQLSQSIKKLSDEILCMARFESKLFDDIVGSKLFDSDQSVKQTLEDWQSFTVQSSQIGDEYVIHLQRSLLDPIKKLQQTFKDLKLAIRFHEKLNLTVSKYQRRVTQYSDKTKTGTTVVKLEESKRALTIAQGEFARNSQVLVNDLSKFLSGSVEMLRPLLEGFMAAEVAWIQACKQSLDGKVNSTAQNQSVSGVGLADRLKDMQESFKSLGSLSICLDTK